MSEDTKAKATKEELKKQRQDALRTKLRALQSSAIQTAGRAEIAGEGDIALALISMAQATAELTKKIGAQQ